MAPGTVALTDFELQPVKGKQGLVQYVRATCKFGFRQPYNTISSTSMVGAVSERRLLLHSRCNRQFQRRRWFRCRGLCSNQFLWSHHLDSADQWWQRLYVEPSVTITPLPGSGGSGATATASYTSDGRVGDVSVGFGGSNYRVGIAQAVDDNKHPVTRRFC